MTATATAPKASKVDHRLDAEAEAALTALNEHLTAVEETRTKQQAERDQIVLRIAKAKESYDARALHKAEDDLNWFGRSDNPRAETNFRDAQTTKKLRHELDRAIEIFRARLQHMALTVAEKRAEAAIQFLLPSVGHDRQAASALAETLPHIAQSRELISGITTICLEGEPLLRALQRVHRQIADDLAKLA